MKEFTFPSKMLCKKVKGYHFGVDQISVIIWGLWGHADKSKLTFQI